MSQHTTNEGRTGSSGAIPGDEFRLSWQRPIKMEVENLNVSYGKTQVLFDVNVRIPARQVTAFLGPSGSGKSSFLRALNLMHEPAPATRMMGKVLLDGEDLMKSRSQGTSIPSVRCRVGMLFQRPCPFPQSIFENVAYGLRWQGVQSCNEVQARVEHCLDQVGLWNEMKDRLKQSALTLSHGSQQRLCLARALAVEPEVLLLDEPDVLLADQVMEQMIAQLGRRITVVLVTANLHLVQRLAQTTGVFDGGYLVEYAPTWRLFREARNERAANFLDSQR